MIKIKPPTWKVDAGGILISSGDCWDTARIELELKQLEEAALVETQDKAEATYTQANSKASDEDVASVRASCMLSDEERGKALLRHPVQRYLTGQTRSQPDCADWDQNGKPSTARAYLTGVPTEFSIRRLAYQDYHRCMEVSSTLQRFVHFIRLGLRGIRSPAGGLNWEAKKDEECSEDLLQSLHEANPMLVRELGTAIILYNRPLDDIEGKL